MANTKITSDNLDTLTTLTVDDITLDGSTISDAGDLTLDVGGDIILDAAGDNWLFKKSGTTLLNIQKDSNNVEFISSISDGDMKFRGNDGGSTITAMTIDMSEGGNVGIGTTSPSSLLHLGGATNKGVEITSSTSNAGYLAVYQDQAIFSINRDGADGSFADTGKAAAVIKMHSADADSKIELQTTTSNNAEPTTRMTILKSGNVGIGTTSPNATLNVNGTIRAENERFLAGREDASAPAYAFHDDADTGMFNVASNILGFSTSGTERMRISSSGKVGIGETSPDQLLHIKSTGDAAIKIEADSDNANEDDNAYIEFSQDGGLVTGYVGYDTNSNDFTVVNKHTGSDLTFKTADTVRMRIDGDGHIGINMTPAPVGNDKVLSIYESSTPRIKLHNSTTGTAATDGGEINMSGSHLIIENREAGGVRFFTNGSERGRFSSTGHLLVGKTVTNTNTAGLTVSGNDFMSYTNNLTDTGDRCFLVNQHGRASGVLIEFRTQNSNVGTISLNTSGNMVYGGTSDYRLKENINYTWNATDKLKQLKPCEFEWKSDKYNGVNQGFIAHEVQSVIPQAVMGDKDALDKDKNPSYQMLDNSKLVPLLVKTIQELEARIEALEG